MTIMHAVIDGIDVTRDLLNPDEFSLEIQKDESANVVTLAMTNALAFVGQTYARLIDRFYINCTDIGLTSILQLHVDCCNKVLVFEIRGENIDFDDVNCRADLTLLTISEALRKYNMLRSRTWWQNDLVRGSYHPKIKYIDNPDFWQRIVGGSKDWGKSKYHSFHIAPLIYPIIQHNAGLVGLSFRSQSVFDQYADYKQIALVLSQYREGKPVSADGLSTAPNWRDEIAPVETTVELLQNLAPLFNAELEITSTELIFEQKGWREKNANVIMDLTAEIRQSTIANYSGMKADPEKNFAFARLQYADDTSDSSCRRVKWVFSDVIEWNPDNDPSLRGSLEVTVPYSIPHCVGDQGYYELLTAGGEGALALRQIWGDLIGEPVLGSAGEAWESGGQAYFDRHILFMENGISQYPKIILVPQKNDPELVDTPAPGSHLPPKYYQLPRGFDLYGNVVSTNEIPVIVDYPNGTPRIANVCPELSFREELANGLYRRFYESQSTTNQRHYKIEQLEWLPADFCGAVDQIFAHGLSNAVLTVFGKAMPEKIDIDFESKLVRFHNLSVKRKC